MLSSRVDGDSHKWIDTGNRETRTVRRLHHSAEAICLELPQQSYHQCDQSSIPSCGDGVFSDERPGVKMKLNNIWNYKLQAQGECTSTRDGVSKEGLVPRPCLYGFCVGTAFDGMFKRGIPYYQ